jgi:class 3 adenylate cyclase
LSCARRHGGPVKEFAAGGVRFAVAVVVFGSLPLFAGLFNPETGSYIFQTFTGKDYGSDAGANWAAVQDARGVMYFANTGAGVLEFDGQNWRSIPLGKRPFARSLAQSQGTIYVGGQGDFGFLRPDKHGRLEFVSLLNKITDLADRKFADVWRILPAPEGIYFSSYSRLFRLNSDGTIKVWKPVSNFGRAVYVAGSLYVKTRERGLLKMQGDQLVDIPGGKIFAGLPVEDAVVSNGAVLIATNDHFYRVTESGVDLFPTSADAYFARNKGQIYTARALPDGEIAVGTTVGGLVLLSSTGALDRIVSKEDGLPDEYVSSIFVDREGSVWVTENNGITKANPGLTRFDEREGLHGDVISIIRHDGVMYAGTTAGLFRMTASPGAAPRFDQIAGINGEVNALLALPASELLAATNQGVFVVTGKQARLILETALFWDLSLSLRDPSTVYVAGRRSVFVLHRTGSAWAVVNQVDKPDQEFRSIIEDADGRVWASTLVSLWRFDFHQQPVVSQEFDYTKSGIVPGSNDAYPRRFGAHVVFTTAKGLMRFSETEQRFVPDPGLGPDFAGGRDVSDIFEDPLGGIWVTGRGYHGILRRAGATSKWLPMPLLASGIDEIHKMQLDPDGVVWATRSNGILYRWQPSVSGNPDRGFSVLARSVSTIGEKASIFAGAGAFNPGSLPHRQNSLRFEFAAPFFEQPSSVEYQVRLDGADSDWSDWTHETRKDYTNLFERTYDFRVRARSPHGTVSKEVQLSFRLLPPFYRTWWAYTMYTILGVFGVWGIVRLRTRQLEEDKRKLEITVEERTVEIREQRDEIHRQERKSHALLLNILPSAVADELKQTGAVKPVGFEDVTVCFTDFVGFTLSSEKMAPRILVDRLNEYFTRFDEIIARYGLEKMKTIGDAYMFASGLPGKRASHAVDAVLAALEMAQVVRELAQKDPAVDGGLPPWNIRIGLHSGPVVAGVVGIKKFAFDIWGNTVNFAARMESSGVHGRVNMSERTYQLTRGLIDCEARGQVKIKEGRELTMFLARGPAQELLEGELIGGIPAAFVERYRAEFSESPSSFPQMAGLDVEARTFLA